MFSEGVIMGKRWALIFTTVVLFSFLLLGCSVSQNKEKYLDKVTTIKFSEVTKIVFSDGRGRNKPFTLDDKQKISEFIKLMDNYVIKKEKKHIDSVGWIHMADFYNGDTKLIRITFTNPLEINGKYYDIVKGGLSTAAIDTFIREVNPAGKHHNYDSTVNLMVNKLY
jgi:hypothetical protein